MPSILSIYSHNCRPLVAQLEAPTTSRGWVLNGYGKNEFTLGLQYLYDRFHPREESVLQWNNLIYVEHIPSKDAAGNSNGKLPPWVGVILPNRDWEFGMLHASAYSAETILTFDSMPLVEIKGTPATMFLQMLEYARQVSDDIVIHPGIIEDIPQTFSDILATSAYDHIRKLVTNAGMDWDVTAEIDSRGNLQLYANLYRRKGSVTSLVLHADNTESAPPLLSEQGTPYNTIYGYSSASTAQDRYFAIGRNQAAIDKNGVMAANHTFSGVTDQTALANAAQRMADALAQPVKMVHRNVLDDGKAFDALQPGNVVTIKDTNVGFKSGGGFGFEAQARILSVDYNDLSNKCPLNLEVI